MSTHQEGTMSRHVTRTIPAALAALALLLATTAVASAAGPIDQGRDARHKEVKVEVYGDDICGDRANATTYTVTWRVHWVEFADSVHFSYTETGRYVTDFDDPSIMDYESQFTEASHFDMTPRPTCDRDRAVPRLPRFDPDQDSCRLCRGRWDRAGRPLLHRRDRLPGRRSAVRSARSARAHARVVTVRHQALPR